MKMIVPKVECGRTRRNVTPHDFENGKRYCVVPCIGAAMLFEWPDATNRTAHDAFNNDIGTGLEFFWAERRGQRVHSTGRHNKYYEYKSFLHARILLDSRLRGNDKIIEVESYGNL